MWKFVKHHEFYLGILILLSCVTWITFLFKGQNWYKFLPLGISWIGFICLFDFLERKYFAHSIVPDTTQRKRKMLVIGFVSLLFCTILEGIGVFIFKLWYYPFFSLRIYLILAPFAFVAYTLLLYLLYEFARDFITRFKKISSTKKPNRMFYGAIINIEIILGVIGYFFIIFNLTQKENVSAGGFYILASVFVCTFFIFEFICFKQNKTTLTYDILSGNLWLILFIITANIIALIIIEFANIPFQAWAFAGWPLNDIRLFSLPVIAILLWPLQFPVFLSMLRAVFPSKEVVW